MATAELAERTGISRDLLYRVERRATSNAGCPFELAAIVGIPLFAADPKALEAHERRAAEKLSLPPLTPPAILYDTVI